LELPFLERGVQVLVFLGKLLLNEAPFLVQVLALIAGYCRRALSAHHKQSADKCPIGQSK